MAGIGTQYIARARTDAEDRLIEVDGKLAELNRASGGGVGETLAVPELLALVVKAREYGLRVSRPFTAIFGGETVTAWADIAPGDDSEGGCEIAIADWQVEPRAPIREEVRAQMRAEISRHLAECTARLDADQNLLSIETDAPDLVKFAQAAGQGLKNYP